MIRIATRSSAQARTQAEVVGNAVKTATGEDFELVFVDTLGDKRQDVPLHTIGGQGVFVKEVQHAVLDGLADVAIHSAKDLPSLQAHGLVVAAWCERRDPRDVIVGSTLSELRTGATLATGSVRRRAQLSAVRPDLNFVDLRGNITTRLTKVPTNGAIVMAAAALEILGLTDRIAERLEIDRFIPMVGQGCVAVECRTNDDRVRRLIAHADHAATRFAVETERTFLAEVGAGCTAPLGAHVVGGTMSVFMASGPEADARRFVSSRSITTSNANDVARELAREALRAVQ
ncbi:MAG: hydroxymethylbilane synthase [Actinomycetota bacterium]